ncbi:MAG: class I SAM-dependent methyltransferase [Thermoguttaceae bacterium]|nr:class I SAM-dependent methyltransferase [Thermoguttaceae bacterium]
MDITRTFYNNLANRYDRLFLDWDAATREQASILDRVFNEHGFDRSASVLDCACGVGTQSIGLAELGYRTTASDFSEGAIARAKENATRRGVVIRFERADFRALSDVFSEQFDIAIVMDNALPHMLSKADLKRAVESIVGRIGERGLFVASIRDYDRLLIDKPSYSPPYVYKTDSGRRVSFQTWDWENDCYRFVQYLIDDEETLGISKYECEYRAVRREELTEALLVGGCSSVQWKTPEETGFYQPIVVARKG